MPLLSRSAPQVGSQRICTAKARRKCKAESWSCVSSVVVHSPCDFRAVECRAARAPRCHRPTGRRHAVHPHRTTNHSGSCHLTDPFKAAEVFLGECGEQTTPVFDPSRSASLQPDSRTRHLHPGGNQPHLKPASAARKFWELHHLPSSPPCPPLRAESPVAHNPLPCPKSCAASRTSQRATRPPRSRSAMVRPGPHACREMSPFAKHALLATSNDPWGPVGSDMAELAQMTYE